MPKVVSRKQTSSSTPVESMMPASSSDASCVMASPSSRNRKFSPMKRRTARLMSCFMAGKGPGKLDDNEASWHGNPLPQRPSDPCAYQPREQEPPRQDAEESHVVPGRAPSARPT